MKDEWYTVIALGMRYWFALLGVLIVWRAFHWLRRDRREKHRRLRQLPDAGMVGEFVSLNDAGDAIGSALRRAGAQPRRGEGSPGFCV